MTIADNDFGDFELKTADGTVLARSTHPQPLQKLQEQLETEANLDTFLESVASDDGMPVWEEDTIGEQQT